MAINFINLKAIIFTLVLTMVLLGISMSVFAAPQGKVHLIKDCMVIFESGTYKVTKDLPARGGLLPGSNCILIEASSVVLDLNDHSITGAGIATGIAISDGGLPLKNINIRRGTITGFANGINLAASSGSIVENVKASGNSDDGISIGSQSVVRYNIAIENNRGIVMKCPGNAIGNSAWDNLSNDLFRINASLCNVSEGHNSFGSSDNSGGSCTTLGFNECAGTCTDTQTSEASCGACGNACSSGEICSGGVCNLSCQVGLSNCAGVCTNTLNDENNCGSCGTTCSAGEICSGSVCSLSCQSGLNNCAGICTDTSSDENNCGGCGTTCSVGEYCVSGACTL